MVVADSDSLPSPPDSDRQRWHTLVDGVGRQWQMVVVDGLWLKASGCRQRSACIGNNLWAVDCGPWVISGFDCARWCWDAFYMVQ